jgi:hypothetical protein
MKGSVPHFEQSPHLAVAHIFTLAGLRRKGRLKAEGSAGTENYFSV